MSVEITPPSDNNAGDKDMNVKKEETEERQDEKDNLDIKMNCSLQIPGLVRNQSRPRSTSVLRNGLSLFDLKTKEEFQRRKEEFLRVEDRRTVDHGAQAD